MRIRRRRFPDLWNLHSHSLFSAGDALPSVESMVSTVSRMGQPALGLTDHGNVAGSVQLYKEARKNEILPFPGSELYVVDDRANKRAKRHHMCVLAFSSKGYENLVGLSTLTNKNFYHKPLVDHADLAHLSESGLLEGLAFTSGCYFGMVSQNTISNVDHARVLLKTYAGWFDRFYIELQNHEIDHGDGWNDSRLADRLFWLAEEIGIPCVLTQDAHYVHPEDRPTHEAMKRLISFGPDPDDAVFPGDGFHLADEEWFTTHHPDYRMHAGYEGLQDLLLANTLSIPELDSYHYNIPFTVSDPQKELHKRTYRELIDRGIDSQKYIDRLNEELVIIKDTGMAGYLILAAEVTDWCRENGVFYQARGSAAGSIVCWLLGITQPDPIKWKLSFERFISRDRMKPPDVDLDVEHSRRPEIVAWLETRFSVHQIGTWQEFTIAGDEEDSHGSLRVRYFSRMRQTGQEVKSWSDVPPEDKRMLFDLANTSAVSHYGTNAAGFVLTTSDEEFYRLVPMMWVASSETMVTQYSKDDVEVLGLVKMDVLGLKTLSVIHKCLMNLDRDYRDGLDWIPLTDGKTYRAISGGKTDGVFQLEGWAARRGCQDLKPTKIRDVIAAMALFRPATQNSGATKSYIARKHNMEKIPERHPIIQKHTADTYGIMLFQEQVISILRDLGMNPDDLTAFLKAVKASNSSIGDAGKVIAGYQEKVRALASEFSDADWDWLWHAIEGFSAYGFNQAHSTVYGLTAYRCAYLSVHHPLEFFAALLNIAAGGSKQGKEKKSKEDIYIKAARERGLRILSASVNDSGVSYEVDKKRQGIRRGLMGVKGIGKKTAMEIVNKRPEGGYTSVEHMCRLVDRSKITGSIAVIESGDTGVGIIRILKEHGALEFEGV